MEQVPHPARALGVVVGAPPFTAIMDCVEVVLPNSLRDATTTTGIDGHASHADPRDLISSVARSIG
nr:hypothetical protein [Allorhizocola rhizosphaerae]